MTTRTKGLHYLTYSRSSDILKWGGGELTKIVTPMPSFLTLIFPSPESFQWQRKTQRERALAPEGQTQKGLPCALKSSGPAYALGFSVCGIWWIFQCWEAKHPHLLYLATVLLTFPPAPHRHYRPPCSLPTPALRMLLPAWPRLLQTQQHPSGILSLWLRRSQHQGSPRLFMRMGQARKRKEEGDGQKGKI